MNYRKYFISNFLNPLTGRRGFPSCEGRRILHNIFMGHTMPDGQNDLVLHSHLTFSETIEFILWPFLIEKRF